MPPQKNLDPLETLIRRLSADFVEKPPMEIEISIYLAKRKAPPNMDDILQWWKDNQGALPLLAEQARKYLCIPASSTPLDKLYPAAGANTIKLLTGIIYGFY